MMGERFDWRNLRDFGIGFTFWPLHWWPWFSFHRDDDAFGGRATLTLGPVILIVDYNAHDGPLGKPLPSLADDQP
jgi:hypothetical protein